jgi:hypothetical protein
MGRPARRAEFRYPFAIVPPCRLHSNEHTAPPGGGRSISAGKTMDFLRALKRLPRQLLWAIGTLFGLIWRGLRFVFGGLFGQVRWQAPDWMVWSGLKLGAGARAVRANPTRTAVIAGSAIAFVSLAWLGYWWWQHRPRPQLPPLVTAEVHAPERTTYEDDKVVIHPLTVTFSDSIAPIELVGKPVTQGIALEPPVEGKWTWESDRELKFEPAADWPVGQDFRLKFERKHLAEHVRFETLRYDFASAPFEATLASAEFYQNPQDPTQKKAVFDLSFGHPVDPAEFERRVALVLEQPNGTKIEPKFVISYDEKKLHGYVHSEPLAIPDVDAKVALTVAKGVRALRGGPGTPEPVAGEVRVPGRYTLALDDVTAALADNARNEPDQVLVLAWSEAVNEKVADAAITAWVLPKFNPKTPEAER